MKRASWAITLGVLAALGACRPTAPPPTAELVGFRALLPSATDPTPLFDAEALPVIRVEAGIAPFTAHWTLGEREVTSPLTPLGGGALWAVAAPPPLPTGRGVLVLRSADGGERRWPVWWRSPPPDDPAAPRPERRISPDDTGFDAALWGGVARARAAQVSGDADRALAAWRAAADDAATLGVETEVSRRLRAAAFAAFTSGKMASAASTLAAADVDILSLDPIGRAKLRYNQGLLAYLLGNWRDAERAYHESIEQALHYGERGFASMVNDALASLLADLGDTEAAIEQLRALPPSDHDEAGRVRYASNLAWYAVRGQESVLDRSTLPGIRSQLVEARTAALAIEQAGWAATIATNQAWAALLAEDYPATRRHLADAAALDPEGEGFAAPYAMLIDARLALAEGRLDAALAKFTAVEARARRDIGGGDAELGWRARFGAGRTLRAKGDAAGAIEAFGAALGEVERLGLRASVRGDRAVFHADRRALTEELVALLIAERRIDEAFGVADAARARPMRALAAGLRVGELDAAQRAAWAERLDAARGALEAWRASAGRDGLVPVAEEAAWRAELAVKAAARDRALDEAFGWLDSEAPMTVPAGLDGGEVRRRLGAGEVLVAFGPGRWAFRVDRDGVTAREVRQDADLLGSWRPDVPSTHATDGTPDGMGAHGIEHIYLIAGDRADAFALPTAGPRPLLVDASVSFLPYAGVLATERGGERGPALVVADPRADLPHAASEGRAVAKRLTGARLLSGSAASLGAVVPALAEAGVFHFAGHGVLSPAQPWDAHLRLAGSDRLGLATVLTHPVGARLVVLSGCETGTDAVLTDQRVVGLPEAFLAAGAQAVVATDRPVDDAVTRRFIERFYGAGGAERPAAALRAAALALRGEGVEGWSAYRLIGVR